MKFQWHTIFDRDRTPRAGTGRSIRRPVETRARFELRSAEKTRKAPQLPWRGVTLGIIAVTMVGAAILSSVWLYFEDNIRVQELHVIGATAVDHSQVIEAADLYGSWLPTADLKGAAQRIETVSGVKLATVTRDWPNGIDIYIEENQGWGYWQTSNQRLTIDEHGKWLAVARQPDVGAPTIRYIASPTESISENNVDSDAVQLVERLASESIFEKLKIEPSSYVFRDDRGLTVLFDKTPDVIFGDSTNFLFKVSALSAALETLSKNNLSVAEIDLRFGRNVVLR